MSSFKNTALVSNSSCPAINGRVYPNGRAGFAVEKTVKAPIVSSSDLRSHSDDDEEFRIRLARQHSTDVLRKCLEGGSPPGSSNAANSHKVEKQRKKRGSKGLTAHGRKIILNAIDYLTWRFGKSSLSFGTVTLPAVSKEEDDLVTQKWAEIIRRFTQTLRRRLNEQNLPGWTVGAYETQPRRSQREGGACLHFHFVFVARVRSGSWRLSSCQIRDIWRRALVSVVPSLANRDFRACENVQRIRKSAASYIAKYLSKGTGILGDVAIRSGTKQPSSWWSCSLALRRIVSRSCRTGRFIGAFLSGLHEEHWLFKSKVEITDSSGNKFTVGWFGQLRPGWSQLLDVPMFIPIEENYAEVFQFPFAKVFHDGFSSIVLNVGYRHIAHLLQRETQPAQ